MSAHPLPLVIATLAASGVEHMIAGSVASAEDTILAKLEWAKASESERQRADVVSVLAVRGAELDNEYLDHWASELGVVEALADARRAAD